MKCLLIQPSDTEGAMIHLGLGYVAAALERRGDSVRILDMAFHGGPDRKISAQIAEAHPDVVGITAQTPYYSKALKIARLVKSWNPACPVVLGGAHASILTADSLADPAIDIVVRGEGDITIVDLVNCLEAGGKLDEVRGISFKRDGVIIHNEQRAFISDLDSLDMPAWHLFEMDKYRARIEGRKVAPVMSSRGCPFKCIFCYRGPAAGKTFRGRNPEKIVAEIEYLHRKYQIGDILFVDDIFTLNKQRAERICDLLIEKNLPLTWRCQSRADCLSLDLLKKMKRAHCIDISMGIESGNEKILETTGKAITKEKVREGFRLIREAGLSSSASFIIGLPGDTTETVKETIQFARELNPNFAIFYAAMPYPGTELAKIVQTNGGRLPEDWDAYRLMVSELSSAKMLSEFRISNLSEKEMEYFLKTAQIEFQMGRLLGPGTERSAGLNNVFQIARLMITRKKSFREKMGYIMRILSNGLLYMRARLAEGSRRLFQRSR
jgi:anaerobic magnesium-protoporphyrin IX monomethyl ester cyclase